MKDSVREVNFLSTMTPICCKNWATKTIVRRKPSIRHDSVLSWNRPARIFRVKIILTSCTGAVITKMKCHLHIHTKKKYIYLPAS